MRRVMVLDAEKLCAAVELHQENSLSVGDSLWGTLRLGLSGSRTSAPKSGLPVQLAGACPRCS